MNRIILAALLLLAPAAQAQWATGTQAPVSPNTVCASLTLTGGVTTAAGCAATVVTNANLTGPITSTGNATAIASQTGTGTKFVVDTAPTIASLNVTASNTAVASSIGFSDNSNLPQISGYGTGGSNVPIGISLAACRADGTNCTEYARFGTSSNTYFSTNPTIQGGSATLNFNSATASIGLNGASQLLFQGGGSFPIFIVGTGHTIGNTPSASPSARTLGIGESSRGGTDSNIAGASGTIQSGDGTGTGTVSTLIFQTPVLAASGTTAQTQTTQLVLGGTASVNMPNLVASSGAAAGTLCGSTATGGNISIDTTVACLASSRRFKDAIVDFIPASGYKTALDELMAFRPVTFHYKPEIAKGDPGLSATQPGLIAEDVNAVDPRLVAFEPDGVTPRGVRYQEMVAVLTAAIKEQQHEIEDLKRQAGLPRHGWHWPWE